MRSTEMLEVLELQSRLGSADVGHLQPIHQELVAFSRSLQAVLVELEGGSALPTTSAG